MKGNPRGITKCPRDFTDNFKNVLKIQGGNKIFVSVEGTDVRQDKR